MTTLTATQLWETAQATGFNSNGWYVVTDSGKQVSISFQVYDELNAMAEQFQAEYDQFIDSLDDRAEYQQATVMGYSFS